MPPAILFISPELEITETLAQTVALQTGYRVCSAVDGSWQEKCPECANVVFLDLDFGEQALVWARALRKRCPQAHLFLLESGDQTPLYPELAPWTLLHKPLDSARLLGAIERALQAPPEAPAYSPEKTAQALTIAIQRTSAELAVLLEENRLVAWKGKLPPAAIQEAAEEIRRLSHKSSSNLLRFIFLKQNNTQYMLYALPLDETHTLGVLFPSTASFAEIRVQAERITARFREALDLSTPPEENGPDAPPEASKRPDETPEETPPTPPEADESGPVFPWEAGEQPPAPEATDENIPDIRTVLTEIPPPTPPMAPQPSLPPETKPPSIERNPPVPRTAIPAWLEKTRVSRINLLTETRPTALEATKESRLGITRPASPQDEHLSGQPPLPPLDEPPPLDDSGYLLLEPASPAYYNLNYACLLLTRRRDHKLTGDLRPLLERWMRDIAVAYGWRIKKLNIGEETLQWVVSVPPTTSANEMLRIFRTETTRRIFESFPHYRNQLADDFWAPGYLLTGNERLFTSDYIQRYVQRIRSNQEY
jgi:REP element-mobilizing transposase RayT